MFWRRNVFCPEVALYARHVFLLFLCQRFQRIETIYFFERQIAADGFRLRAWLVLITIEVAESARREDGLVAAFRGFGSV